MENKKEKIGSIVFAIVFLFLVIQVINHPPYNTGGCGGKITLTYQEGHEGETADFNEFVFEDFPEYIFFENLNDSYCYWVGRSFKRDASLHFTQIGYKNSSIVLIQWTYKLVAVWLLRGDPLDHLTFVLLLSVDW